jgi:hypothetical protein
LITQCRGCHQPIRDCTGPWAGGRFTVAWYHIATGWRTCEDGTVASPVSLVNASCPEHKREPDESCPACVTSAEVSLHFHNAGRCIPALCPYPHS